jgi:hypothetical protein
MRTRPPFERKTSLANLDLAWRVSVIAVVSALVGRMLGLLTGPGPALTPDYLQAVLISLVTGLLEALVLLPLARRLPYGMGVRFSVLFLPLYWIGLLSNLVEAAVNTSLPVEQLIAAAVIFALPNAVTAWLVAWLIPARDPRGTLPGLRQGLQRRPLHSWVWRTVATAVLFAALLQLFGVLWGPLIARYYQDPAYIAQAHTLKAPDIVVWPEEFVRGVLFAVVVLPVLAVMPGRGPTQLLRTATYVALIDAAFESWLPMLSMTTFPVGFRIGEGLDLTTDAIARGIVVALLLAVDARFPRVGVSAPAESAPTRAGARAH